MTRHLLGTLAILGVLSLTGLAADKKAEPKFVPLFNGKDLTGWKVHPNPNPGQIESIEEKKTDGKVTALEGKLKNGKTATLWAVENGVLIGSGPATHLFSERGDFENFHYRVEAMINDKGNSGQYFRTQFGPGFPKGYEAQINATHTDKIRTGSLYPAFGKVTDDQRTKLLILEAPHKPDEWFTQEVIAEGNHLIIKVNGKTTVDFVDEGKAFTKGHFALQQHDPGSLLKVRKIEVAELPSK